MKKDQAAVFTLMVDNEFGVLTRITALIRRAGWNIRSLAVAETEATSVSRLTICLECKNNTLEFVLERLGKLDCVRDITIFSPENQVAREMAILRISKEALPLIGGLGGNVGAETLYENSRETLLSVSCRTEQLDALLEILRDNGLIEVARTGTVALKLPQEDKL